MPYACSDEKIKSQIEKSKKRTTLTIISSDNNVREFARVCSCEVVKSEDFVNQLNASQTKSEESDRISSIDDPEEFKRLFGVD